MEPFLESPGSPRDPQGPAFKEDGKVHAYPLTSVTGLKGRS